MLDIGRLESLTLDMFWLQEKKDRATAVLFYITGQIKFEIV